MIFQEFYCTISGGGCGGYFTVKLNDQINGVVEVICPKCGHVHRRSILNGEIRESQRFSQKVIQQILSPMAAWHKESIAKKFCEPTKTVLPPNERDGVVITKDDKFLRERWFELYGGT